MPKQLRKDSERPEVYAGTLANIKWCREEFGSAELGDQRLNERLVQTAAMLAQQPLSSINQSCPNWSDTKAAYRLFANERCTPEGILKPHLESTRTRIDGHRRILVIQDSSTFNFNGHPATEGLGPIGKRAKTREQSQGLLMHTALAVVPHSASGEKDGIPLGIISQKIWARSHVKNPRRQAELPIEKKESYKWIEAMQATIASVPAETECVTVCDREGDIFELMDFAEKKRAKYLIRSSADRRLSPQERWNPSEDGRSGPIAGNTLRKRMAEQPCATTLEIVVPRKVGLYPDRAARVEIRFAEISFTPPAYREEAHPVKLGPIRTHVIWVKEIDPPEEITNPDPRILEEKRKTSNQLRKKTRGKNPLAPVDWMLLTNVWIKGLPDALERVRWYEQRWQIECFHKILKSGCAVERCRLQYADRLEKFISLSSVIAWRIHWMTRLNHDRPTGTSAEFLSPAEWQALYCKINKTVELPSAPPTIRQAVRWIAQLGGFLGRKGDGEPGSTTLWRGWQRLHDITEDWLLFRGGGTYG